MTITLKRSRVRPHKLAAFVALDLAELNNRVQSMARCGWLVAKEPVCRARRGGGYMMAVTMSREQGRVVTEKLVKYRKVAS